MTPGSERISSGPDIGMLMGAASAPGCLLPAGIDLYGCTGGEGGSCLWLVDVCRGSLGLWLHSMHATARDLLSASSGRPPLCGFA